MRKLSIFLAFALLMTGSVFAQSNGIVSIDNVTGEFDATALKAGKTHVVSINFDYRSVVSENAWGGSNGFEVYSPDGADWGYLQGTPTALTTDPMPSGLGGIIVFQKHFDFDGATWTETGDDALDPAMGGVAGGFFYGTIDPMGKLGATTGVTNGILVTLEFTTQIADNGLTMCIDTCDGITAWEWAAGSDQDFPQWDNGLGVDGPRCYEIYEVPNKQAVFTNCAGSMSPYPWGEEADVNHCGAFSMTLCGMDTDVDPNDRGVVTFEFATGFETGFGTLDANTGDYMIDFNDLPQSGVFNVEFRVFDEKELSDSVFTLSLTVENNAPVFTTCPTGLATVSAGASRGQTLVFSDADVCDVPFLVDPPSYTEVGTDYVVITGGTVEFFPDIAGGQRIVVMTVTVSDGELTDECVLQWNVIEGSAYQVELDKVEGAFQGHFTDLDIILHSADAEFGLGGFDLLVAYDASALVFQMALEGDVYADPYNWEYFTYRYGGYGNCGNACPSGMLRVIGLAETNNGVATATCVYDAELEPVLASLRFLVSNDRNLECQYVPVRFFWYDCTDNILASCDGSRAYLSTKVYDYRDFNFPFQDGEMSDGTVGFPTYQGTQDDCVNFIEGSEKVAKDDVDFQNGGVDIICADSIDARGDINLNGLAHEIADAVMFTNYFINGLGAFGTHIEGSIAASDVNGDGIALSVADLVYLVRVVIGDAAPYEKSAPIPANFTFGNDLFNIDVEMGAAHIVVEGNVTPTLLAGNMEMKYASNGQTTNILVYSTEAKQTFSGDFLRVNGNVVSTEFATYAGYPVAAKIMPANFELGQNYPNPFNPTTKINFTVPNGEWELGIYNITGQLVESRSGVADNGIVSVDWDASELSSGIYFYRVTTGDQSMTKKAVLLK